MLKSSNIWLDGKYFILYNCLHFCFEKKKRKLDYVQMNHMITNMCVLYSDSGLCL